jgi:mevalonate kinase
LKYIAQAPGKIIIMGEHFVVHGSYAIAAAINKYTTVKAKKSDESVIISKDLNLISKASQKIPRRLYPYAETLRTTLEYLAEKKGVILEIESEIPISSGLGSSASGSVALVAATSSLLGHALKEEEIIKLAMVSERIIHGNPSGIDPTIAASGGVVLFKPGFPPEKVKVTNPIEFIISYSGSGSSTSKMISIFNKSRIGNPNIFNSLVHSTSTLAKKVSIAISNQDLTTIAAIMNYNQSILSYLGVSSEIIDQMVETVLSEGCIGAKLTGGGGGGSIIAITKNGESYQVINNLRKKFSETWSTKIPMNGVKVRKE